MRLYLYAYFSLFIHSLPNLLPVRFFLGCICEVCSSLPNPSQGADRLYPRAQHRWTKNDINSSTLLAGSVIDLNGSSNQFFIEYEQRLKNDFKFFIETVINGNIDNNDYNFAFKEDTNFTIKIAKYF